MPEDLDDHRGIFDGCPEQHVEGAALDLQNAAAVGAVFDRRWSNLATFLSGL